jgi:hypothetical protein
MEQYYTFLELASDNLIGQIIDELSKGNDLATGETPKEILDAFIDDRIDIPELDEVIVKVLGIEMNIPTLVGLGDEIHFSGRIPGGFSDASIEKFLDGHRSSKWFYKFTFKNRPVSLDGFYTMGPAHREIRRGGKWVDYRIPFSFTSPQQVRTFLKSRPKAASPIEVFDMLLVDAGSVWDGMTEKEFIEEFGYTDDVDMFYKGQEAFRACLKTRRQLQNILNV